MLTQDGWLGRVDLGGDTELPLPGMDSLLTVRATGTFLIPPVADNEAFPGAGILG
jgi:hypothetical protein